MYHEKKITVEGRTETFFVDAASYQRRNLFKEEPEKQCEIQWSLLESHSELWDLEGLTAYIPSLELLLLTKIKAFRDRNYDLAHKEMNALDRNYIQSKIWKDAQDIRGLIKLGIDDDKLTGLIREAGLTELKVRILETFNELGADLVRDR